MAAGKRFPQEVRERAVRMVFDHQQEYASQWEALRSISSKIGCSAETLRSWVRQAEIDTGRWRLGRISCVLGTADIYVSDK